MRAYVLCRMDYSSPVFPNKGVLPAGGYVRIPHDTIYG